MKFLKIILLLIPALLLSQKYNLHPNQISLWKQDFLEKSKQILESKKEDSAKEKQDVDALFAKIGQLQMELDFLKKKLS